MSRRCRRWLYCKRERRKERDLANHHAPLALSSLLLSSNPFFPLRVECPPPLLSPLIRPRTTFRTSCQIRSTSFRAELPRRIFRGEEGSDYDCLSRLWPLVWTTKRSRSTPSEVDVRTRRLSRVSSLPLPEHHHHHARWPLSDSNSLLSPCDHIATLSRCFNSTHD